MSCWKQADGWVLVRYSDQVSQITLFQGENDYGLAQEKRRWMREFAAKHGADNLLQVDGQSLTFRALLDDVSVMPFLASKRLVVVEPAPDFAPEEWQTVKVSIHPDVLLLLVDRRAATGAKARRKNTNVSKGLETAADAVKEFKALTRRELEPWLRAEAKALGASFGPGAEQTLLELLGEDQALLSSEMVKLATAAAGAPISPALVEELVSPSDEGVIWRITDLIGRNQATATYAFARRFLDRGGEPFQLWNTLLLFVRHAAVMADVLSCGDDPANAVRNGGVPFPMVSALCSFAQRHDMSSIIALVDLCCDLDRALKTGELKASDDAQAEILAVIDRLLLALIQPVSRSR